MSGVDESEVRSPGAGEAVATLARMKAEAVAGRCGPGALVLGCDSLLDLDGEVLGKPVDTDEALRWWRARRGRRGTLLSGHHLIDTTSGRATGAVSSTVVHFGHPSEEEIAAYVGSGEPLGVAGGFTLEGRGAPLVDRIEGDPGTVIGLSLPLLRSLLVELGHHIFELWTS